MPKKAVINTEATCAGVEADTGAEVVQKTTSTKKRQYTAKKREFSPTELVTVKNGYNGVLVCRSRKTSEVWEWEEFGAEQDMELQDLRAIRNSDKAFFENNYFIIDDYEVLEYLGVARFYENALSIDDFETLFEMKPAELAAKIATLSKGQKESLAYMARRFISDGKIDSIKTINTLEESLGIELIER